ncbi:glycosyltransferase family 4 protein [Microbacterium sp. BDGP8]|uniref:glycosyltransferase family 4 protein n=1 Tax=Microbacterium sp. BDGP8 TaxID=3035531 RepID=UPI00249F23EB|nr:glycosyltransferase family 4 protein [Microbacterium sp. BDGP8]WHE35754.1 glycosyltransferase family 4 protein [Microbacterium sp. BDGP8]
MSQPLPILMTGSEWFATRPGGLNRYFYELFSATARLEDASPSGAAFGDAPEIPGALSWEAGGDTRSRVLASRRPIPGVRPRVVDRHFSLYGPPRRRYPDALQIVHFQGPWADESRVAGGGRASTAMKRVVERRRYHDADHLIVLSAPFKAILVEKYGIAPERVTILAPGVDAGRFAAARGDGASQAAERPTVLCVRRLEHRMGIDVLIRAWDDISRSVPDAELRIVGTGTAEDELRELATRSAKPGSITFAGRLSDEALVAAYSAATISVVPTTQLEGFGLIALESLAAGKPVVVTDCGGLPDGVKGLDPSLVVTPGDETELARRITEALLGKRPSAAECVAHAKTFSWESVAQRHLALYRELGA